MRNTLNHQSCHSIVPQFVRLVLLCITVLSVTMVIALGVRVTLDGEACFNAWAIGMLNNHTELSTIIVKR